VHRARSSRSKAAGRLGRDGKRGDLPASRRTSSAAVTCRKSDRASHAGAGCTRRWAISDRIFLEHLPRHRDLGHLEGHVPTVADGLGADLDQLLAQAGQRPRLRGLGHRQRPHEVAEVVGKGMKLEADGVGHEGAARQAGPLDRALALFDPLLAGAAVVVEGDDALGRSRQIGNDKADTRVKLTGVPLDLRHEPSGFLPALRLIAKLAK
jgi:hypothetical protein